MMSTTRTDDPRTWAGYRAHTIARSTGTLCVLVNADEAGIESDPELPWALLCHEHSGVCCFQGQRPARNHLAHPEQWCPTCQGEQDDPAKPREQRKAKTEKPAAVRTKQHERVRSAITPRPGMPMTPPRDAKERRMIEASIRTGERNAAWYLERGCDTQAATILMRIGLWKERLAMVEEEVVA